MVKFLRFFIEKKIIKILVSEYFYNVDHVEISVSIQSQN